MSDDQKTIVVEVAGALDKFAPEQLEALAPLLLNPMIQTLEEHAARQAARIEALEAQVAEYRHVATSLDNLLVETDAQLKAAVGLLEQAIDMTGEPECFHDHHDYCQAHNLQPRDECWVAVSKALIAQIKGGE